MLEAIIGAVFGESAKIGITHLLTRPVKFSPKVSLYEGKERPRDGVLYELVMRVRNDGQYPIELTMIEDRTAYGITFVPSDQKPYENDPYSSLMIIGLREYPNLGRSQPRSLDLEQRIEPMSEETVGLYLHVTDRRTWQANLVVEYQVEAESHVRKRQTLKFDFPK